VKDSLLVCDQVFPLIYHFTNENGYADIGAEARLFSSATGIQTSQQALDSIGSRIYHLERCIMVREGRTRIVDEEAAQHFQKHDARGVSIDPKDFSELMDEFYAIRGWDPQTGWPTRHTLLSVGLEDIADRLGL
jgi:aldehyde:ferredoxin oxidoreductase